MRRWSIPRAHVEAFLTSMRMDITVTGYATYADLERYMYGSAAVIGLQMLPILEPVTPAAGPARARAAGRGVPDDRTSSATSARTCAAAGSTCRRRTWTRSG